MGVIQLLDTATTNKIAAGEVVANPASVVKELVENSIDAGSTRITVEITRGGLSSIKVLDNGYGIALEDLPKAFMRHATSKIKEFKDLDTVSTMGFRGEALASIASVARVTMTSRVAGSTEGYRIVVEGGVVEKPTPVGCAQGTTVEVADLFFNVPARRKFLKAAGRETAAVNEVVSRLALGNPDIAFKLKNDSRTIFETYGSGDVLTAVAAILGQEVVEHLLPVESSREPLPGWKVTGYVSTPFYTRSSRKYQYYFVNNRWVSNQKLRYALDHAYRSMIPRGRYPIAILFLEAFGQNIDVNVDPTKNTIRISDEKPVLDMLIAAVRDALLENRRAKGISRSDGCGALDGIEGYDRYGQPVDAVDLVNLYYPVKGSQVDFEEFQEGLPQDFSLSDIPSGDYEVGADFTGLHVKDGDYIDCGNHIEHGDNAPDVYQGDSCRPYKILGQLGASYILYEKDNSLYIVDQHAAHERIRYEAIRKTPEGMATQLVIPQSVTVTPQQIALLEQLGEDLDTAGFQFDFFGGSSVVLREIPIEMSFGNPETLFKELLELIEENLGSIRDLRESFMYSLACKTAVKAGQILSREEMEAIVDGLFLCSEPWTCPHGRPTTISLSAEHLLKEFKRK